MHGYSFQSPFYLQLSNTTNYLARNEASSERTHADFLDFLFTFPIVTVYLVRACINIVEPMDFCILLYWNLTEMFLHDRIYSTLCFLNVFIA